MLRQDSRFNPGEPGSFHLVSKIIDNLGIDMIYTIDSASSDELMI